MARKRKVAPKKDRTKRDWKKRFLAVLRQAANIRASCEAAGITRKTYYVSCQEDSEFAAAVKEAKVEAVDRLENEMWRRSVDGCDKPVFHKGEVCGHIREYSDTLAIFLAKAHKPKKYRERVDVKHGGKVRLAHDVEALTDEQLATIAGRGTMEGGEGTATPPSSPARP